jgi:hypothetical protein
MLLWGWIGECCLWTWCWLNFICACCKLHFRISAEIHRWMRYSAMFLTTYRSKLHIFFYSICYVLRMFCNLMWNVYMYVTQWEQLSYYHMNVAHFLNWKCIPDWWTDAWCLVVDVYLYGLEMYCSLNVYSSISFLNLFHHIGISGIWLWHITH